MTTTRDRFEKFTSDAFQQTLAWKNSQLIVYVYVHEQSFSIYAIHMRAELLISRTLDRTQAVFGKVDARGSNMYRMNLFCRACKAVPRFFALGRGRGSTRIGLARSSRDTLCTRWLCEVAGVRLPPATAVGGEGGGAREKTQR